MSAKGKQPTNNTSTVTTNNASTNACKYILYNKINILSFDIENALDEVQPDIQHIIKKIFYFFSSSSIESKYAKPFLIKFILEDSNEAVKWNLSDIYEHFKAIPKFLLPANVLSNYNVLDNSGKVFAVKRKDQIEALTPFENSAYDFEVNFGSKLISAETIKQLTAILEQYEIFYEFSDNSEHPVSISLYEADKSKYQLHLKLDGKIDSRNKYEVQPNIQQFNNSTVISLGKFTVFNNKPTTIPNDDDFAVITTCSKCNKHILVDYWKYKGTPCPYCNSLVKFIN